MYLPPLERGIQGVCFDSFTKNTKFILMRNRRSIIWYHPDLKDQAKELRNNCTYSEKILWEKLKGKQMMGYDFHRQKPINYYIIDFFCHELMLAIEIDGSAHNSEKAKEKDRRRQEILEEFGIRFLRFSEEEIRNNLDHVIEVIREWADEFENTGEMM
jgi:very-short-patch-repair endonuclease